MNKEEVAKKVIDIINNADYVDPAEYIYDGQKFLDVTLRRGEDVSGHLFDLYNTLLDPNSWCEIDNSLQPAIDLLKQYFDENPYKNTNETNINFHQVVENSQCFDSLEQILNYVSFISKDEYLKIGLENTIKNGYKLVKE
jgi:hypothetical protein